MPKFKEGDRVMFESRVWGFHCAGLGLDDRVMHLNAKDNQGKIKPITGIILGFKDILGYKFKPDGWPENAKVEGFYADPDYLHELPSPDFRQPGTITRPDGKKILPMEELLEDTLLFCSIHQCEKRLVDYDSESRYECPECQRENGEVLGLK